MIHTSENPAAAATANRVLEIKAYHSIDVQNPTENLIELQADWVLRRYPITRDRARLVANLYFGGAA